jgi:hypothetical protein
VRPLEQLGIDIDEFNALDTTAQFRLIATNLQNIAQQSTRARIAQELFGRSGAELIPFLRQGNQALDEAIAFLDKYDLQLSQIDVSRVEAANDAWTRLRRVISGLSERLAVELAPAVENTADILIVSFDLMSDAIGRFTGEINVAITGVKEILLQIEKFSGFAGLLASLFPGRDGPSVATILADAQRATAILQGRGGSGPAANLKDDLAEANKEAEKLQKTVEKITTTRFQTNLPAATFGSQEALAIRFGRELQISQRIASQHLEVDEEAAETLVEIREVLQDKPDPQPANIGP